MYNHEIDEYEKILNESKNNEIFLNGDFVEAPDLNDEMSFVDALLAEIGKTPSEILYPDCENYYYICAYAKQFVLDDKEKNPSNYACARPDWELYFGNIEKLVEFYQTRVDAPGFLREKIFKYLVEVGFKEELYNTRRLHAKCTNALLRFIDLFKEDDITTLKFITAQYKDECAGRPVTLLSPNVSILPEKAKAGELHHWFDRDALSNSIENSDSSNGIGHLRRMRSSGCARRFLKVDNESVLDNLEERFPNFSEVINFYKAQFRLSELTQRNRIQPVLLLGKPGIGKTEFSKSLAKALNTDFSYIDMSCTSSSFVLNGLDSSWNGAKPGRIVEAMVNSVTASPVVLLDEVDKANGQKDDSANALLQLLEENSAKTFVDEFVGIPLDISTVIFIACANSIDAITEPLQSRLRVFHVQRPTREQQEKVIQNIYKNEINNSPIFKNELNNEVVSILLEEVPRVVKRNISDAVSKALLEFTKEELMMYKSGNGKIPLDVKHFESKKPSTKRMGF